MPELVTKKATFIYNHNGTPLSCRFTYRTDSSYLGKLRLELALKLTVQHLQHTNKTLGMLTDDDSLAIHHAVERELFRVVAEDAGVDLDTGEDLAACGGAICASSASPEDNTLCNPVTHLSQNSNILPNQIVSGSAGITASGHQIGSTAGVRTALSGSVGTGNATLGAPAANHDSLSDSETIVCNHTGKRLRRRHGTHRSLLDSLYHRLWKNPTQKAKEYIQDLRAQPRFGLVRSQIITL